MIKQLLMIDELNESLHNGVVCFKVEKEEKVSHFFFTRNRTLISFLNDGFSPDLQVDQAYDILNKKTLEIEPESFDGAVYSVAHCYLPEDEVELKNAKVYIGNNTGAVVISDKMLHDFSNADIEDFGIKQDDKCFIFSACLGIKNNQLEDIYLVNDEGEKE
jgi:dsDNA-binding SOS-regulon protein